MPKIKYKRDYQGLSKYEVYKIDENPNSEYFGIRNFPDVFTSGKNYFLITGTKYLKHNTSIAVEVLDVNGNTVYNEIPDILLNGTDRVIIIFVYEDTPYGLAKITVLGELSDCPPEWVGKYNVKWEREFLINPTLPDVNNAVFINDPIISVNEIYDSSGSITTKIYTQATSSGAQISGLIYGDPNYAGSKYSLQVSDSSFTKDMVNGTIYVPSGSITLRNGSSNYTLVDYNAKILNVINSNLAISDIPFILQNKINKSYKTFEFDATNYRIDYNLLSTSSAGSGGTGKPGPGSNYIKSYLKINISNIGTYIGVIKYVDLYKDPGNVFIGRYDITTYNMLVSGSQFGSYEEFLATWTQYTSSGFITDYDDDNLINSIVMSGSNASSINKFVNNQDIFVSKGSEYEVSFNLLCKSNSYSTAPSMSIYLTGSTDFAMKPTNTNGYLLSTVTPTKNTFLIYKKNFIADKTGKLNLSINVNSGNWYVSNFSVSPYNDENFSADTAQIIIENPARTRDEIITIRTVFIDGSGNAVGQENPLSSGTTGGTTPGTNKGTGGGGGGGTIPETGGTNKPNYVYIPVTGSNIVISHDDNLIEGDLFVGSILRSGIHISGKNENGNPASMIRSVGYSGFKSAVRGGTAGFVIYSGSILPSASDDYGGIGLELASTSGSLRFHVNGQSDTFLEVIAPNFFFGQYGLQYISGSNGVLEISSSQFYLSPEGNAYFEGTMSAAQGNIGGWAIGTSSLVSGFGGKYTGMISSNSVYRFFAGSNTTADSDIANAKFYVREDGYIKAYGTLFLSSSGKQVEVFVSESISASNAILSASIRDLSASSAAYITIVSQSNYLLNQSYTSFTQSYYQASASFVTVINNNYNTLTGSINSLSSSFINSSASFDQRELQTSASLAAFSSSQTITNINFSQYDTYLSSSISSLSSSYIASSASFGSSMTSISASVTLLSSSFSNYSASDAANSVTDAKGRIVKPQSMDATYTSALYLTQNYLGYFSQSGAPYTSWNAYISSSGEFLFKKDAKNYLSFGSGLFQLYSEDVLISGSNVIIGSSKFNLYSATGSAIIAISSSGNFLLQQDSKNLVGLVSGKFAVLAETASLSGSQVNIVAGNFFIGNSNTYLSGTTSSLDIKTNTFNLYSSNINITTSSFLYTYDSNNLFGLSGSTFIVKATNAILSGSSVSIMTPSFILGGASNYISGSGGTINIKSDNFNLSSSNVIINSNGTFLFKQDNNNIFGNVGGTFILKTATASFSGDSVSIITPNFLLGSVNNYISGSGTTVAIKSDNFYLSSSNVLIASGGNFLFRKDQYNGFGYVNNQFFFNAATASLIGDNVSIITKNFILGGASNYISGSGGNISVNAQTFNLNSTNVGISNTNLWYYQDDDNQLGWISGSFTLKANNAKLSGSNVYITTKNFFAGDISASFIDVTPSYINLKTDRATLSGSSVNIEATYFRVGSSTNYILGTTSSLSISSSKFVLSDFGDAYFNGTINAAQGNIGDWNIISGTLNGSKIILDAAGSKIYKSDNLNYPESDWYFIDFTPDILPSGRSYYIKFGPNFAVSSSGLLIASGATIEGIVTASGGQMGGWTIGTSSLTSGFGGKYTGMISSASVYRFFAGSNTTDDVDIANAKFYVREDGYIKAYGTLFLSSSGKQVEVFVSESVSASNAILSASIIDLSASSAAYITVVSQSNYLLNQSYTSFTQSYYQASSSFVNVINNNYNTLTGSINSLSSSFVNSSASFDQRELQTSASLAAFSSSQTITNINFSQYDTYLSSSISSLSSSYIASSASFSSSMTSISASVTLLSSSFSNYSASDAANSVTDAKGRIIKPQVMDATYTSALYLTQNYLGYFNQSGAPYTSWNAYISSSGEFLFKKDAKNYLSFGSGLFQLYSEDVLISGSNVIIGSSKFNLNSATGSAIIAISSSGNFLLQQDSKNLVGLVGGKFVVLAETASFSGSQVNIVAGNFFVGNSNTYLSGTTSSLDIKTNTFNLYSSNLNINTSSFLYTYDNNNLFGLSGSVFIVKATNAILSGSSVSIITPSFLLGGDNNYISGSGGTINIKSDNFNLSSSNVIINSNGTFLLKQDANNLFGNIGGTFILKTATASFSGDSVSIITPNFLLGSINNYISGSSGVVSIKSDNFYLSSSNVLIASGGNFLFRKDQYNGFGYINNQFFFNAATASLIGDSVNIITKNFVLGGASNYISGSNGNIAINAQTFNLNSVNVGISNTNLWYYQDDDNQLGWISGSFTLKANNARLSGSNVYITTRNFFAGDISASFINVTPSYIDLKTDRATLSGSSVNIEATYFRVGSTTDYILGTTSSLLISSSQFYLSPAGDAYFAGTINAAQGNIGSWTIGSSSLTSGVGGKYTGMISSASVYRFFAGSNSPADADIANAKFYVTQDGAIKASNINATGVYFLASQSNQELTGWVTASITASSNVLTQSINNLSSSQASYSTAISQSNASLYNIYNSFTSSYKIDSASFDKIVTDAQGRIVKPNTPNASSGSSLYLTQDYLGYYDASLGWNAYISRSGEFLFQKDVNNKLSFGNNQFYLATTNALISGSSVSILTPNFLFGSATNYISGSGGNLKLRTDNFDLISTNVFINTSSFLYKQDDNNLIGMYSGSFTLKSQNATISGSNVTISATTFFAGNPTSYISATTSSMSILSGNATLSGSSVNITAGTFRVGSATNYLFGNNSGIILSASQFYLKAGAGLLIDSTGTGTISGGTISGTTINASTITAGTTLNIGSGTFTVDASGNMSASNAYIIGNITAGSRITGGTISIGSGFAVDASGNMTASNALFTGTIRNGSTILTSSMLGGTIIGTSINVNNGVFYVDANGNMSASNAYIIGNITAGSRITGGTISIGSGFAVDSSGNMTASNALFTGTIRNGSTILTSSMLGGTITGTSINVGGGVFYVDANGNMTASNANIRGTIIAGSTITADIIAGTITIGSGFAVDASGNMTASNALITGTLRAGSTITGSTIYTSTINSGSIVGSTIDIGGGNFTVSSTGTFVAKNGIVSGSIYATNGYFNGTISTQTVNTFNLDASQIKTGFLDAARIQANTIDSTKLIASGVYAITASVSNLSANSINAQTASFALLYTGAVSASQISVGKIQASQIDTSQLIVGTNVGPGTSVSQSQVVSIINGTVTADYINSFAINATTVTSSWIYAGNINANQINAGTIDGRYLHITSQSVFDDDVVIKGKLSGVTGSFTGTVQAGIISGGTITGSVINGGSFNGGSINIGNNNFTVDSSGNLISKNAVISGSARITSGDFYSVTIHNGNDYAMINNLHGFAYYKDNEYVYMSVESGYPVIGSAYGGLTFSSNYLNVTGVPAILAENFMYNYNRGTPTMFISSSGQLMNITSATITGLISAGSVSSSGAIIGSSLNITGQIIGTSGQFSGDVIANDFIATSDRRLKNNLVVIENPINMLNSLSGYKFTWNEKSGKENYGKDDYGVIAQEVEKIMPEAVHEVNGIKRVSYNKLIPVIIEAIKDMNERIKYLENKLKEKDVN